MQAATMFEKSVPTAQIAYDLRVSEKSVRLWRRRWTAGGTFSEDDYIAFLDQAHQRLRAPIVLIWDNLNTRVGHHMHALTTARPWLTVTRLPAYAPNLNPTEGVWRWMNAA
ncbi:transposase [Polymorphospora sp. NPDC051019]|uniref:transposase n=1 Tax=Polymorphospora sp. NPDC051019 TaxID=3155725 RepID=UPI0034422427